MADVDPFLEAVRDSPTDAHWAVFADELQSRGDVRGRLIALAHAGKARPERLLRNKHRAALGSARFWQLLDEGVCRPTWRHGHLESVKVDDVQALDEVLASPLACALQGLTAFVEPGHTVDVLRGRCPALRELALSTELIGEGVDVGGLLEGMPRLRAAKLFGVAALPAVSSGALGSLIVWLADWYEAPPCSLGVLELPALRDLGLRVRHESTPALTRWLRESLRAPRLRHLTLEGGLTSQLVDALADAPFSATLERLVLLTIDDATAHALLERRAAFPKLGAVTARFFRTSQATETRVREAFQR